MLASFESFLETAKLKTTEEEDASNFDDAEQTSEQEEREGIDVRSLNRLASDHRKKFGAELPHPKMDALVAALATAWSSGRKALVFVRRVASVTELKRKLDDRYDDWLVGKLRAELPARAVPKFNRAVDVYCDLKRQARDLQQDVGTASAPAEGDDVEDAGGTDTFFAWFFRGKGPRGYVSGANVKQRFLQKTSPYFTFFARNYAAELLGARPGLVTGALAVALGRPEADVRAGLRRRMQPFLGKAQRPGRGERFEAAQGAAVDWLRREAAEPRRAAAEVVWQERFASEGKGHSMRELPELEDSLETPTFWTELLDYPELHKALAPAMPAGFERHSFRARELFMELLAAAARLGHAYIDLYLLIVGKLDTLDSRSDDGDDGPPDPLQGPLRSYLGLLEKQRSTPLDQRHWGAFDELRAIAENVDLILDTNDPEARTAPLGELARTFGRLLRQQQPVGGMSGQVNATLVRQFRMPGYPLVLVSTDRLQEGEDLHTFCSAVHHYGISWMPSAMEQRIGRIDRVRSETDRRLSAHRGPVDGAAKLQVHFPYLEDTIEILQVRRVLGRMTEFLRLMHEGLKQGKSHDRRLNVRGEMLASVAAIEQLLVPLESAFKVRKEALAGAIKEPAVGAEHAARLKDRFEALAHAPLPVVDVGWEESRDTTRLFGTARLLQGEVQRQQPFTLLLQSRGVHPLVRCISPVGRVSTEADGDEIQRLAAQRGVRIGAVRTDSGDTVGSYTLTVEDDVVLAGAEHDAWRIGMLVRRVVEHADQLELYVLQSDEPLSTFRVDLAKEWNHGS